MNEVMNAETIEEKKKIRLKIVNRLEHGYQKTMA
jgi:hypothetical protein